jgi:cell division protein FtsX
LPYAQAAGLAGGVATVCAGLAMIYAPDYVLPAGQAYRYGYGQALGSLAICGLSLFLIGIGWLLTRMAAMRHLRDAGTDGA